MADVTLINPPNGKSMANDYAERSNQWFEKNMRKSMTEIEREKQMKVGKLNKEQKNILKDIHKIRTTSGTVKNSKQKHGASEFLAKEKERLRSLLDNSNKDDYRSDGNSSDEGSSVWSYEEEDESTDNAYSNNGNLYDTKSNNSNKRSGKATYEERSRDNRLTNLHRRYSAQVRTDPIVNVNRMLKYGKK